MGSKRVLRIASGRLLLQVPALFKTAADVIGHRTTNSQMQIVRRVPVVGSEHILAKHRREHLSH